MKQIVLLFALLFTFTACSSEKKNNHPSDEKNENLVDQRDGHVYQTVQIGNQTWMAENLAFNLEQSYPPDGNNDNIKKYGRLYTWQAAKIACPRGWHLPTKLEFEQLLVTVCGSNSDENLNDCGTKLNNYGFSALPAGGRNKFGSFPFFGFIADFWSATPDGSDNVYFLHVDSGNALVFHGYVSSAYSVRCLKDEG